MSTPERWDAALEQLAQISAAMNASFSEETALTEMLQHLVTDLGYKATTLRTVDAERHTLELKAAFGVSAAYLAKGTISAQPGTVDEAALQGQRVPVEDVRQDTRFAYGPAAAQEGLAGMLAVPLTVYQKVIGVMHVYTAQPHQFSAGEQALVAVIANLAAQAIQRARLFSTFRRLAQNVNSSLELKSVLAALVLEAANALSVRAASIRLLGPKRKTLHLAATFGLSQTYLNKGPVLLADSLIDQQAISTGEPVAIADLAAGSGFQYVAAAQDEGIRSVLVVPLKVFDTSVGVLRLYSGQAREFSPEETSFAVAVAELGAVAIENAKLHEDMRQRLESLKQDADGWYRYLALS